MAITITIPLSRYRAFARPANSPQRWGQMFYEFMELHKVTDKDNKIWCDMLYNASDRTARQMVLASIDHSN